MTSDTDLRDAITDAWIKAGVDTNLPMNDVAAIALKAIEDRAVRVGGALAHGPGWFIGE